MSYRVKTFNRYADGTELTLKFDTESVMIKDALMDADKHVEEWCSHNERDYNERSVIQNVTLCPEIGFR